MLKTFLANQDTEPEVYLPVRSTAFSVKAKIGKSMIINYSFFFFLFFNQINLDESIN